MYIPRIYHPAPLALEMDLQLSPQASHHLIRVLRLKRSDPLWIFNGQGGQFFARIQTCDKGVTVTLERFQEDLHTAHVSISLGQCLSRGHRMDFSIQKACELGVSEITPLLSEKCAVKLPGDRIKKKMQHWQQIIISACEQCGRTLLPTLLPPSPLSNWLTPPFSGLSITLDPQASQSFASLSLPIPRSIRLLIGPESGLTDLEVAHSQQMGFKTVHMGPLLLRTETATVAALSACHTLWGNFAHRQEAPLPWEPE